jgi:hypothetical protein
MQVNFNSDDKKTKGKSSVKSGSFEDMIKARAKNKAEIEENIRGILADYDGGLIAIVRVGEDENGEANTQSTFVGGTAGMSSQIRMIKALSDSGDRLLETTLQEAKGDPEALLSMVLEAAKAKEK